MILELLRCRKIIYIMIRGCVLQTSEIVGGEGQTNQNKKKSLEIPSCPRGTAKPIKTLVTTPDRPMLNAASRPIRIHILEP